MRTVVDKMTRVAGHEMLQLTSVSKSFGSTRAVNDVSFTVGSGELLGVAGHNGAGKSTLFRLIHGDLAPDTGQVVTSDADVQMVSQELVQPVVLRVDELAALRRVGRRFYVGRWRGSAWKELVGILDTMFPGHGIAPDRFLEELPLSRRQMLECACVFMTGEDRHRLYLMDEPTSALGASETEQFYSYIRAHAERTTSSFLITTHRLVEMTSHMDRLMVLRDGAVSAEFERGASRDSLIRSMGRLDADPTVAEQVAPPVTSETVRVSADAPGEAVARLTQAPLDDEPQTITLRRGEVVGLAGLEGHGQAECLSAIFAAAERRFRSHERTAHLTVESLARTAYVSGDRRRRGVLALWNVRDNLALTNLRRMRRGPVLDSAKAEALYDDWAERLGIIGGPAQNILALSGGNQQKVLLARALATDRPLVVLDDPTRGVDQSTKEMMYMLLHTEAAAGKCMVWFSTENDELRQCDRVLVFRNGRIAAELSGDRLTEDLVLQYSFHREPGR